MLNIEIAKLPLLGNYNYDNNQLLFVSNIRNHIEWEPTIDYTHFNYIAADSNVNNDNDKNVK